MKIHNVEQRSEAWHALRCGRLTGSRAKDMLAKIKSGEAAARRDLKMQLLAERLSGCPQESTFTNAAMEWGIQHEADAVAAYEAETGRMIEPIGFCEHDTMLAGTSPDGFVGDDGILSIKCPKTATHLSYWRARMEPAEHWAQNTHELWLTGRAWVDFVSYDPRLPAGLQLFVLRVTRTKAELEAYEREVLVFLGEVNVEVAAIQTLINLPARLEACL